MAQEGRDWLRTILQEADAAAVRMEAGRLEEVAGDTTGGRPKRRTRPPARLSEEGDNVRGDERRCAAAEATAVGSRRAAPQSGGNGRRSEQEAGSRRRAVPLVRSGDRRSVGSRQGFSGDRVASNSRRSAVRGPSEAAEYGAGGGRRGGAAAHGSAGETPAPVSAGKEGGGGSSRARSRSVLRGEKGKKVSAAGGSQQLELEVVQRGFCEQAQRGLAADVTGPQGVPGCRSSSQPGDGTRGRQMLRRAVGSIPGAPAPARVPRLLEGAGEHSPSGSTRGQSDHSDGAVGGGSVSRLPLHVVHAASRGVMGADGESFAEQGSPVVPAWLAAYINSAVANTVGKIRSGGSGSQLVTSAGGSVVPLVDEDEGSRLVSRLPSHASGSGSQRRHGRYSGRSRSRRHGDRRRDGSRDRSRSGGLEKSRSYRAVSHSSSGSSRHSGAQIWETFVDDREVRSQASPCLDGSSQVQNIRFRARHVPGVVNVIADSLSRSQMESFRALHPKAREVGEPCPQLVWEIVEASL
ncbi:hypothetical protein PRIEUP_LOCUS16277 [Pristimantis euphronides]